MPTFNRVLAAFAALAIAIATGLGAWASHGLQSVLSASALHSLETGLDYQFFHSIGLLVLATISGRQRSSLTLRIAMMGVAVGIVLFCGGVYASSLGGAALLARAAPTGGTLLILAWLTAGVALLTADSDDAI